MDILEQWAMVEQEEQDEVLLYQLEDTWYKSYNLIYTVKQCKKRLKELKSWDKAGKELERKAKIGALERIIHKAKINK